MKKSLIWTIMLSFLFSVSYSASAYDFPWAVSFEKNFKSLISETIYSAKNTVKVGTTISTAVSGKELYTGDFDVSGHFISRNILSPISVMYFEHEDKKTGTDNATMLMNYDQGKSEKDHRKAIKKVVTGGFLDKEEFTEYFEIGSLLVRAFHPELSKENASLILESMMGKLYANNFEVSQEKTAVIYKGHEYFLYLIGSTISIDVRYTKKTSNISLSEESSNKNEKANSAKEVPVQTFSEAGINPADEGANLSNAKVSPTILSLSTPSVSPSNQGPSQTSYASVSVASGTLNMRKIDNATADIAARIPNRADVEVLEQGETWCKVLYNGQTGYVLTKYLKFDISDPNQTATPVVIKSGDQNKVTSESAFNELKKGDKGKPVTELQDRLIQMAYFFEESDGIYAESTLDAVKHFQKDAGLKATGKADVKTIETLYSDKAWEIRANSLKKINIDVDTFKKKGKKTISDWGGKKGQGGSYEYSTSFSTLDVSRVVQLISSSGAGISFADAYDIAKCNLDLNIVVPLPLNGEISTDVYIKTPNSYQRLSKSNLNTPSIGLLSIISIQDYPQVAKELAQKGGVISYNHQEWSLERDTQAYKMYKYVYEIWKALDGDKMVAYQNFYEAMEKFLKSQKPVVATNTEMPTAIIKATPQNIEILVAESTPAPITPEAKGTPKTDSITTTRPQMQSTNPNRYEGYSFEQLQEEYLFILKEMWKTDTWQSVRVPAGMYKIGEEIPSGEWAISGDGAAVYIGTKMNSTKTGVDTGDGFLDAEFVEKDNYPNGWIVNLEAGWFIDLSDPVDFKTPVKGTGFTFK